MNDRVSSPTAGQLLAANIADATAVIASLSKFAEPLGRAAEILLDALLAGRKLLCCGNGGSAADGAHFAAEIAGRYALHRRGYAAIDLAGNHSLLTSLMNDYPAAEVFARQVEAFGRAGDVLAVFSTSGASENVRLALEAGKRGGLRTLAFLGRDGGACKGLAEVEFIVPSPTTARIQEAHELLYHTICQWLDPRLEKGTHEGAFR